MTGLDRHRRWIPPFVILGLCWIGSVGCVDQPTLSYPNPALADFSTSDTPIVPRNDALPPPLEIDMMVDQEIDMEVVLDQSLPKDPRLRTQSLDWVQSPMKTRRINEKRVVGRFLWTRSSTPSIKKKQRSKP